MASSTDVFPLPLGPVISTERPSRVVSLMPNRFLMIIFVVFIDKAHFLPYDGGETDWFVPVGPRRGSYTRLGFFMLRVR